MTHIPAASINRYIDTLSVEHHEHDVRHNAPWPLVYAGILCSSTDISHAQVDKR